MNGWADRNKTVLNANKTKDMRICFKDVIPEPPSLMIGNDVIERVKTAGADCIKLLTTV